MKAPIEAPGGVQALPGSAPQEGVQPGRTAIPNSGCAWPLANWEDRAGQSLFKHPLELKIGALELFPMRTFKRTAHDGLVLDDVRDLQFLVKHQESLQGKYGCLIKFGSPLTGPAILGQPGFAGKPRQPCACAVWHKLNAKNVSGFRDFWKSGFRDFWNPRTATAKKCNTGCS